jgi:hypothetical protein
MTHTALWHRPWVRAVESVAAHVVAIVVGFAMMILGLGLGVTMIMLPVGLVVGLTGAAIFVGGLFAHVERANGR